MEEPLPPPYPHGILLSNQWRKRISGWYQPRQERKVKVHTFLQVDFQEGAWKQVWAEAGRITYKATQDRASVEIVRAEEDQKLRFRATKGTKIAISGNAIHLPDSMK